ncbi:hypothetical protein Tco_0459382 [Tanacetum coccineum]
MEGYKLKDLKSKGFDSIQEMFDRSFKRQKVEDDKETAELKQCLEIIPDKEEVTINAIPLAVKKDLEDLEDLYKLVKAKYESTRPVEDLDLLLWGDLKTMFEPHIKDEVFLMVAVASPRQFRFIVTCSYPTDICKDMMKAQVHVSKDFGYSDTARFCSPADLEAFTEIMKDSLLGKRHGKGTDFGRAVREIIDSYEELRQHEQVDGVIALGQTVSTNGGKSSYWLAHP